MLGLTLVVIVQCQQCDHAEGLALVNALPAACPTCGTIFAVDAVTWAKDRAVPQVALSMTPRSRLLRP